MNSDETPYIIYAELEPLIEKKWTDVQTIQLNLQQQSSLDIFLLDIQCQLIIQKINIVYIVGKIA